MSPKLSEIQASVLELNEIERELLIDFIVETLGPNDPMELERAWIKEVDRRAEEILRGEAVLIPHEEVVKRFLEK